MNAISTVTWQKAEDPRSKVKFSLPINMHQLYKFVVLITGNNGSDGLGEGKAPVTDKQRVACVAGV